jgi:hypothetical protein
MKTRGPARRAFPFRRSAALHNVERFGLSLTLFFTLAVPLAYLH